MICLLTACDQTDKPEKQAFVKGPNFSVKVDLSKKAENRLAQLDESIIVSSMFSGTGTPLPGVATKFPDKGLSW